MRHIPIRMELFPSVPLSQSKIWISSIDRPYGKKYNGNKKRRFCFLVKNEIIEASIESLRQEGLKFSVDTLADKLNISKKTIYKFFPDKEALALALYEKYYTDAKERARKLIKSNAASVLSDLLHLYFDSKTMIHRDIFNKYKLNEAIYAYAAGQNEVLWNIISASFSDKASEEEMKTFRIIVEGSFEKLCDARQNPDAVIERLKQLL